MRYSNTERLGVIETDKIVTKDLGWIFREQPIVDVGIDAFIERTVDGEPKGEFVAVQIKSGSSNFFISENKITLYVSIIHYSYWLSLNVPMILVAHLPETGETFWQEISESNFKKTNKKWKIEVPRKQIFNHKSKTRIENILVEREKKGTSLFDLYNGKIDESTLFDYMEEIKCISESVISLNKITKIIFELGKDSNQNNLKLKEFVNQNLTNKDNQVKALISSMGRNLNMCSKRLESEIEIFSELFSVGFFAFEFVLNSHFRLTHNLFFLEENCKPLFSIAPTVEASIKDIFKLRESVNSLPEMYPVLKEAKKQLVLTIDLLLFEFEFVKSSTISLTDRIDVLKNEL